jgi:hypothetical protein
VPVLAAVQDLSQVRARWGSEVAEGFLSLFQHVLVFGGIRDTRTLDALSVICGDWDCPQIRLSRSYSRTRKPGSWRRERTQSWSSSSSTVRQRRLTPGEVYELADGQALYLSGVSWGADPARAALRPPGARPLASASDHVLVWQSPDEVAARAGHPAFGTRPPRRPPTEPTPIRRGRGMGGAAGPPRSLV